MPAFWGDDRSPLRDVFQQKRAAMTDLFNGLTTAEAIIGSAWLALCLFGVIGQLTGVHFRMEFKWFDVWVGAFIDHENHRLYICPLPCVVFVWERSKAKADEEKRGS
jgi:hypothetical protein